MKNLEIFGIPFLKKVKEFILRKKIEGNLYN